MLVMTQKQKTGRDGIQVGRDYNTVGRDHNKSSHNRINIYLIFFFVLGGIAATVFLAQNIENSGKQDAIQNDSSQNLINDN